MAFGEAAARSAARSRCCPLTKGVGIGLSGQANWDLLTGTSTGGNIYIPVTFDLGHDVRLNINGGWLYDGAAKLNYVTWGAGIEWKMTKNLALIAEFYGQCSPLSDPPSTTDPRFQAGIRLTPINNLDVNIIYGRNINGENAHWLTLGFNIGIDPHYPV